jgi:hypothetical protein
VGKRSVAATSLTDSPLSFDAGNGKRLYQGLLSKTLGQASLSPGLHAADARLGTPVKPARVSESGERFSASSDDGSNGSRILTNLHLVSIKPHSRPLSLHGRRLLPSALEHSV